MVDCILSYAATEIVSRLTNPTAGEEGKAMLDRVRADPRAAKQLLLLSHLCVPGNLPVTPLKSLATLPEQLSSQGCADSMVDQPYDCNVLS